MNDCLDEEKGTINGGEGGSVSIKQPNGTKTPSEAPNHATTRRHKTNLPTISHPSNALRFLHKIQAPHNASAVDSSPLQAELPLNIIVVGGGLGGLATSIALARRGHSVTVLEQAHELGEVGAGIQIPSNSSLLLERWGVGTFLAGKAVEPQGITIRRWQDGSKIGYTKLIPEFRENFGASYHVVHRAHFHEALYSRALQLGVDVRVDCRVVTYDDEDASVELANGTTLSADLIVAADGIKSAARQLVLGGRDQKPKPTGFAAYRATVDVEKILADPDVVWLLEKPSLDIWIGEDRHVMTYTIAAGKSFNMVLSHVDRSDPQTWDNKTALDDMRREFSGWDPQLTKIIYMINKTIKWPLCAGTPLPRWVAPSSKLLILGDAAHAMVPYMSQGAAMAVEDGAALAMVLNSINNRSSIPFALKVFEKERLQRTSQMQQASMANGTIWHFPDGPQQEARDEAMRPEVEGKHFLSSANQWSDPVTQWWAYGYDAEAAMKDACDAAVSDLISKAC
ncbi:related to salicylate hydroxylase [Phialocephala subalpina]|uniref:Related to salicylate hydroxylase n=1 Tax=Phialocephala subalpina TaxID=576137 RepID=A0A1L7XPP8_9HELO|nr:related to salicylate hydroxylase [Phialocephala subalpina]